jgi:hypothetical protein
MAIDVTTSVAAKPADAPAPSSASDPKVVDAIQAHLDAFTDDLEPSDTPVEKVETTEDEPVSPAGEKTDDSETQDEPAEKPAEEAAPTVKEESKTADEPTLPAAYVRSAKARGWTDKEITDFLQMDSDKALQTFERMHTSRSQEIQEWAELGRKVRQAPATTAMPTPGPSAPATPAGLAPINIDEMVAKFGNEDLIRELAGPVNAAIAALAPIVQGATAAQAQAKQVAQEQLAKTVETFFTDSNMASYAEAYGKAGSLTPAQIETRQKVLETADALIAGAAFQGRTLSVQDALVLAHDAASSGIKETVIRDKIRKDVKKRNAALTLKPTAQGRDNPGAAPRSRDELVSRTEDRLAKAFG